MKTSSNNNNIESKNRVYNAIVAAIKSDRMIGRHIAESYGLNGPRPVYGIEVWESIVYVHTDTDRRIFDKAIDRLLKAHTDLFKWADFQKVAEDGPHIVLALTDEAVKAKKDAEKAIREAEKAAKEREAATFFDEQSGKAEREPASEITDENEAARALAGKEARFVISDKDGRETLSHSFTFKDSFRNQANRIWIDVKEKGDVIGRWLMLKYDVIKELANTGRVVVSHPDGERHCITLA